MKLFDQSLAPGKELSDFLQAAVAKGAIMEGGILHSNCSHQPVTFSCSFWSGDLLVPQTQMTQESEFPSLWEGSQCSHPGPGIHIS